MNFHVLSVLFLAVPAAANQQPMRHGIQQRTSNIPSRGLPNYGSPNPFMQSGSTPISSGGALGSSTNPFGSYRAATPPAPVNIVQLVTELQEETQYHDQVVAHANQLRSQNSVQTNAYVAELLTKADDSKTKILAMTRTLQQLIGGGQLTCADTPFYTAGECNSLPIAVKTSLAFKERGYKVLDVDWDSTAHTQHTYRSQFDCYEEIAARMSVDFIDLAKQWCCDGGAIDIVTFNAMPLEVANEMVDSVEMIQTVLKMVLPECGADINVYASDPYIGVGKVPNIMGSLKDRNVKSTEVVLIDDNEKSIKQGKEMFDQVFVQGDGFSFRDLPLVPASAPGLFEELVSVDYYDHEMYCTLLDYLFDEDSADMCRNIFAHIYHWKLEV